MTPTSRQSEVGGARHAFKVRAAEAGHMLIEVLSKRLSISRRKAKALLDTRRVFVNGKRVWMTRHLLRREDAVLVSFPPDPVTTAGTVLFRDDDYLIIAKPPGKLSNGPHGVESAWRKKTALPALRAAHRLDKDTSGCLLMALHEESFTAAVALFRGRQVHKKYLALVNGCPRFEYMHFEAPVNGRCAQSVARILRKFKSAALLEVRPRSGRTHQIRRHLAGKGYPVLGDKVYAGSRHADPSVPRHMLHASQLAFRSPLSGRMVKAQAPLPADFKAVLQRL